MPYLSGPVNSLADFQLEYAGLLMGPGTAYDVPPTWSFLDMGPVRTMEVTRPWGDGSWAGPDFADAATWQLPVEFVAAAGVTFTAAVTALLAACTIRSTDQQLWVKIPGFAPRGIGARTSQRSIPIDLGWGRYSLGAVQWRSATSPVWQSVPRITRLSPATATAALGSPLFATYGAGNVLDFGISAPAGSSAVVSNAGSANAWPFVTVTGPCPAGFSLTMDGHQVTYSGPLAAADIVTVDYSTGRAYLSAGGTAPVDRTYLLTARDMTPVAPGGSSTITFAAAGGTAAVTTADFWR